MSTKITFSILHLIGTLMIPFVLLALGGCMKDKLDNGLGPAIPCADVQNMVNTSMYGSYFNYEPGQAVQFTTTLTPLSQEPQMTQKSSEILLETADKGNYLELRVLENLEIQTKGEPTKYEQKEDIRLITPGERMCSPELESFVSYHNLSTSYRRMKAPTDNCEGLTNCEIAVTDIVYDRVVKDPDTGVEDRNHFVIVTSGEVPVLARKLKICRSFKHPVNGQDIPVTICQEVIGYTTVELDPTPTPSPTPTPTPSPSPSPSATP